MLKKIIKIDNVGLFRKGVSEARELEKVTLIYGDNARGKSTLASILYAAETGNSASIVGRKSLGSEASPSLHFRFDEAGNKFSCIFDQDSWSELRPKLRVFNQDFIDRNVYTGTEISADQRASLLELAIGDAAVDAQSRLSEKSEASRRIAGLIRDAEQALAPHRGPLEIGTFISLEPPTADTENEVGALRKKIKDAENVNAIVKAPIFKELPKIVPLEMEVLKKLLVRTLDTLQGDAEKRIQEHLAKHGNDEHWLHTGYAIGNLDECPYCGQATTGLSLISAYQTYFSEAYASLNAEIDKVDAYVRDVTSEVRLAQWINALEYNANIEATWDQFMGIEAPQIIDPLEFSSGWRLVHSALTELIDDKRKNPLGTVDPRFVDTALKHIEAFTELQKIYEDTVETNNRMITAYKSTLQQTSVPKLKEELIFITRRQVRHSPEIAKVVDSLLKNRAEQKAVEADKTRLKAEIEKLTRTLLENFQQSMNEFLQRFGADFRIDNMDTSYLGGDPRSRYVIKVRNHATVNVGPGKGDLSFHYALSEGDKRTLAFAFFLSTLFADQKRNQTTVVLDDVFTSLDQQRRYYTTEAAVRIVLECSQLIALGHDPFFLREVRSRLRHKKLSEPLTLCVHRDADKNSYLADYDIDAACATEYYKKYTLVERFLDGEILQGQLTDVAVSLRPLVEGHLHKSFPGKFTEGQTFGQMLDVIKNAPAKSPLLGLHSIHKDLVDFNEYVGRFHHDTSGGLTPRCDINEGELLQMARGALNFIHHRKFWTQ